MGRCSICQTLTRAEDATVECSTCRQEYHDTCWRELGGCATYGCEEAAPAEKAPAVASRSGWGNTKTCPACGRTLHPDDTNCRCGADFPGVDPISPESYRRWRSRRSRRASAKKTILVLFIATLTGFAAPVTGPAAGLLARRNRDDLAGSDGTYLAIGYGAAALGGYYSLILLLLLLGA